MILSIRFFFIVVVVIPFSSLAQSTQWVETRINSQKNHLEIWNGIAGVVIPLMQQKDEGTMQMAPIQSFILNNKQYTDSSVNFLKAPSPAIGAELKYLTKSNTKVEVLLTYRFQKRKYDYAQMKFPKSEAGPGYYKCKITVEKGSKVISIEEDTDYDIYYRVQINAFWTPDKARYRGWESASIEDGYEPSGQVYRPENVRGFPMDATVNLDYTKQKLFARLFLWEPAGGEYNSGRYWQLYNSKGPNTDPIFGFLHGSPEKLIGSKHNGPRLLLMPANKEKNQKATLELVTDIERRAPDNTWHPRKRYEIAVYISSKLDLLSPEKTQPIARELNKIGGLGSKVVGYIQKSVKIVPAFYTGSIYMPTGAIKTLRGAVRADRLVYNRVCEMDQNYRKLWDAWRYKDSAHSLLKFLIGLNDQLTDLYINGEGTYDNEYRYWKGARMFKMYALFASALISDDLLMLNSDQKRKLESLIALMARVLWNDNNMPLFDSSGVNFGPENMIYQYQNTGRIFFALLLANDPEFSGRVKRIRENILNQVQTAISNDGVTFASPHYIQAAIDPILFSLLQLKQAGIVDLFKTEKRLVNFSRFYLGFLTPKSVRFSNNRKVISFGDGSEQSASTFGLLAMGLKNVDSSLSRDLYQAFVFGPARFSFAGPVPLAIEFVNDPIARPLSLGPASFPGYYSHFRSNLNTVYENALWLINGEQYSDHRNDDAGELAVYSLGTPLTVSSSSFYSPMASDARIRFVVVPEKIFPQWNKGNIPIAERSLTNRTWQKSELIEFANLGQVSIAVVKMSNASETWFRKVFHLNKHQQLPLFGFYDSIAGSDPFIWSIPMMSEGPIQTPNGTISPARRMNNNADQLGLPSAETSKTLTAGWNRFAFKGQSWLKHFSGGIDWQMYNYTQQSSEFSVGHWGTTWQNSIEQAEFQSTNGRPYSEEQQFLRVKAKKSIFSLLLPYAKGTNPYANKLNPESNSNNFSVNQAGSEIKCSPDWLFVKEDNKDLVVLMSNNKPIIYKDYSFGGGLMLAEISDLNLKVRIHGNSGLRTIVIPGKSIQQNKKYKNINTSIIGRNTKITIDYSNKNKSLLPGDLGYEEYIFDFSK